MVTGATGNIGSAVVRRLLAEGGHEVVGVVRRPPPDDAGGDVTWHRADLSSDEGSAALADAFRGADAVVHLVWGFQPSHDPDYLERVGVGGTRRVVEAVEAAGVPHLLHMSSVGAYAPRADDRGVDEAWPTTGVPTSMYSRHKVAAERLLDDHEASGADTLVTRLRPGIVGQRTAASALLRYGVPGVVPARALGLLPVLPLDRGMVVPMVHSDDVAEAVAAVLHQRAGGAFNLASSEPVTAADVADALGARLVHVPSSVLRPAVSAAWRLRLQPVDTGWLDLAFALPSLDSTRARVELGWAPTRTGPEVLREVVAGMREAAHGPTPALRPRTVPGALRDAVRRGPVAVRRRP